MANSSRKGSKNERDIAKQLSLWWSHGENPNIFWRTAGSGGRATKVKQPIGHSYGDIGLIDPIGEPLLRMTTFEVKKGYSKTIDIMSLIDTKSQKNEFSKFWEQACKSAEQADKAGWGKEPMLITQRHHKLQLITIDWFFFLELVDLCGHLNSDEMPTMSIGFNDYKLQIMRLSDFFEWCSPDVFIRMYNEKQGRF